MGVVSRRHESAGRSPVLSEGADSAGGYQHTKPVFTLTADNFFVLYVNGHEAGKSEGDIDNWRRWKKINIAQHLKPGDNLVAIAAVNGGTDPARLGSLVDYWLNSRMARLFLCW